jgi:catabolite regulation protein CreA
VIETKIFDAKYDRLIWSAVTETIFEGSAEEAIRSFVPVIITELHGSTLLQ